MNSKTIILVIILSVIVGTGIFFADKIIKRKESPLIKTALNFSNVNNPTPTPSSTPKPTLPPLTEKADLEEELNKLSPSDYSNEFKVLKESL